MPGHIQSLHPNRRHEQPVRISRPAPGLLLALACLLALLTLLPAAPLQAAGIAWPTSASAANGAGRWPALTEIPCGAYIVMNRTTGEVLLAKEPDKAMYPASTTKVLTALIALEKLDPNRQVVFSPKAVALTPNASRVGYKAGETVYVRDLLAGLMLASGNDAANAIAEAVSGTMEAFAPLMNERARQAGAQHSNFVTPSGVHHELHVTTARDLALITAAAMKNANFRSLVALESASMPATNLHPVNGWAILFNTNRLLMFDETYLSSPEIRSVTGVKTGSTDQAGDNLVATAVTTEGAELVAVLMKAPMNTANSNKFVSMRTLLEEGARLARKGGPTTAATTHASSAATSSGSASTSASSAATSSSSPSTGGSSGPSTGASHPGESNPGGTRNPSGGSTSVTQLGGVTPAENPAGSASAQFGILEGLRQQLGVSPSAFLTASTLIGLLAGLAFGLLAVILLHRATHRRRRRISPSRGTRPPNSR